MSWDDVVGQDRAIATLRAALERAGGGGLTLLLFGPRGVGKARAALAAAGTLLCEAGDGCGRCASCGKLARETHPDLFRLGPAEGKRWIATDATRQAIDWMHHPPLEAPSRCLLVDPADVLRIEAANALLKTLEEPPGYGVALLVAESLAGLPETVVSRCQAIRFGPLGEEALREILRREGVEDDRADVAVRLGRGSAGRAIAFAREGGEEAYRFLAEKLRDLRHGDAATAAAAVVEYFDGDRERLREALDRIVEVYRDRLLGDAGADELRTLPAGTDEAAGGLGEDAALRAFPILWRSREDVASFVDPRLVIEKAFWDLRETGAV